MFILYNEIIGFINPLEALFCNARAVAAKLISIAALGFGAFDCFTGRECVVLFDFGFSHIFARFFDFADVVIGVNAGLCGFGWLEILVLTSKTLRNLCKMFLITKKRERTLPGLYIFNFFSIYDDYYLHKYYRAHLPIDAKICNNK